MWKVLVPVTCNGTNGGCINCRKTGYDQTPCKVCDKDGVAFKNRAEAKAAIQSLLAQTATAAGVLAIIDGLRPHSVDGKGEHVSN